MKPIITSHRADAIVACISAIVLVCRADVFVEAPTPPPGQIGGPTLTSSDWPLLIKEYGVSSMRYQQVYNASLFTNLDRSLIYITTMTFYLYPFGQGANSWTITNIQVNLSTTQASADNLSTNFADNVGSDDTVVLGSQSYFFQGSYATAPQQIVFDTPFRYDSSRGNLLLDIRVFNGTGVFDPLEPTLWTYTTSTDAVSRVWAPDVNAASATGMDTSGLYTGIQFDGIPTLTIHYYPPNAPGTLTNIFVISWPSQPSSFLFESSDTIGPGANWQVITTGISGTAVGSRFFGIPAGSAGASRFFRLVWPGGYGASLRSKPDSISRPIPTGP